MFAVPPRLVYAVLTALYAGASFGLDKGLVAGLLAGAYALLAMARGH